MHSDNEVMMAKFDLCVLIMKNIANSDATGNATSYSLAARKNYESYAQRLKYLAKEFVNDTMNYLAQWKKNNNYIIRWFVEIYFLGLKRVMSEVIKAKKIGCIIQELALKIVNYNIMRRMTYTY